jgi:alpha-glucosidase
MQNLNWWQHAVVYQIYPRSFQDSNWDGIGDLRGILQRLDYLVSLGVDAIWISPIYPSPMADFGYDISDYCGIDPIFGTMPDFDHLLSEAHARGLRVILDFVPNHTSDRHPWFLESRSSRDNPKRDWYIWRDSPNNWVSHFGGSAWQYDEHTGQYYLHEFLREQPDLNWRNPAVKQAMFDTLRFWLNKGVDGFRVDVMWVMIKDDQFRDNPPNPAYQPQEASKNSLLPIYDADRPEIHDLVAEMRSVIDSYPGRVLIGEIYLPIHQLMSYYGRDLSGANLPFNFQLLQCPWTAQSVAKVLVDYYSALPAGAWPNWVLGNHDKPRIASRVGTAQARIAAMLLFTLPGTLTIYYGEELGMLDVPIAAGEVQDPAEKNEPGVGQGRDPERTPMPWDSSMNAGFTHGKPWLPLGDNAKCPVQAQENDPGSMLTFYRGLIRMRKEHLVLVSGTLAETRTDGHLLRYMRISGNDRLDVILNFSQESLDVSADIGTVLAATENSRLGTLTGGMFRLGPSEGLVIKLP